MSASSVQSRRMQRATARRYGRGKTVLDEMRQHFDLLVAEAEFFDAIKCGDDQQGAVLWALACRIKANESERDV